MRRVKGFNMQGMQVHHDPTQACRAIATRSIAGRKAERLHALHVEALCRDHCWAVDPSRRAQMFLKRTGFPWSWSMIGSRSGCAW